MDFLDRSSAPLTAEEWSRIDAAVVEAAVPTPRNPSVATLSENVNPALAPVALNVTAPAELQSAVQ